MAYFAVKAEEDDARAKYGPGWERALRTIREAKAEDAAREAAGLKPKRRRAVADPDAPVKTRQGTGTTKRLRKRRRSA